MNRIIALLVIITLLFSCSSNNGEFVLSSDKIVGNWKLISQMEDGIEIISDCTKQTTFIFESDRILRQTFYTFTNNNCTSSSQIISSWSFLGDSNYKITNSNSAS